MDVLTLLVEKGIEPKRVSSTRGGEFHSPCPTCGGVDRFHVWPGQNNGTGSFWCRGCGKAGDAIQFLIDFDGKTFQEAAAAMGRDISSYQYTPKAASNRRVKRAWQPQPVPAPNRTDNELWRKKALSMVRWAHENLLRNAPMLSYLAGRGIDLEATKLFQLGWNPGEGWKKAIFRHRKGWGLPPELDGAREKMLWLPRGLVIPYIVNGVVKRLRVRRPNDDISETFKQRYIVIPGSEMDRMLIGPDQKAFVIVEAELDAIAIYQAAGDMVGAIALGSSHAKPDPATHKALLSANNILVALDYDKAGADAWQWWSNQYPQAERWPVPNGKDPGDAVSENIDIRSWIMAGLQ